MDIPKYRVFGGKRYQRAYTKDTKRMAEKEAKEMRATGTRVRIVKYGSKYILYARG